MNCNDKMVAGRLVAAGLFAFVLGGVAEATQPASAYRLSAPYSHDNLTVYVIEAAPGAGSVAGPVPLTLAEALQQRKVVVHETGDVSQLAVENLADDPVFIHAGDIVKGGKQDRVLTVDLILPPRSGRVPIDAFCVEQRRWTARTAESGATFDSAEEMLVGRELKLAATAQGSQQAVWEGVAMAQDKLSAALQTDAAAASSPTSLQLTLENGRLNEMLDGYVAALAPAIDRHGSAIGLAYAIDGRINGADVYGSPDLFAKLWPKLLRAASVEAIAERREGPALSPPDATAVAAFLADADAAAGRSEDVAARTNLVTRESETGVLFETRERGDRSLIHRNYIAK